MILFGRIQDTGAIDICGLVLKELFLGQLVLPQFVVKLIVPNSEALVEWEIIGSLPLEFSILYLFSVFFALFYAIMDIVFPLLNLNFFHPQFLELFHEHNLLGILEGVLLSFEHLLFHVLLILILNVVHHHIQNLFPLLFSLDIVVLLVQLILRQILLDHKIFQLFTLLVHLVEHVPLAKLGIEIVNIFLLPFCELVFLLE